MEGAIVSVATGALKPVVTKLARLLGNEYKNAKGVRKEIESLSDELVAIHAFLLKMSEEENPDVQDQAWMTDVRELSYDIEDTIDEFMVRVDDNSADPDGFINRCKNSLARMKTKRQIAKAIEDFRSQIKKVGERHARYRSRESNISRTTNTIVDNRALSIFELASNLVGIDGPKNEVIKLLCNDDGCELSQKHPKVVSIVGFGGLGKTTLAYHVYQELKGKFERSVFLTVSRNPNMMKILGTILCEVAQRDNAVTEARDEQQLIIKISDILSNKRYLIVIDDIWNVEIWNIIKGAFSKSSSYSKIVTTTRIIDVARSSCSSFSGHVYNMRPLDLVHSRQLFYRILFNSEEKCPPHLEEVSKEILRKCAGLPLAIIAISGLLVNKPCTEDQWCHVKNSIGSALERNPSVDAMIGILSLSYYDLPPHLKTCLLHLSIFPEDYSIEKDDLILRWIAEGFVHRKCNYTSYEVGEMCFSELVNRNLIQRHHNQHNWKVHDTILDFIVSRSMKDNFVTLVPSPEPTIVGTQIVVRRLSLQAAIGLEGRNSVLQRRLSDLSHARSLNVFCYQSKLPPLLEFKHLRALSFQRCTWLRGHCIANIGRLLQLRYLNLKGTINNLPEEIGCLQNLETLNISNNQMNQLPSCITRLGNLVHLFVDYWNQLPDGITKMKSLEILKTVDLSKQSSSVVQELGQLKNLRELNLFTYNHEPCTEHMKAISSCLLQLGTHNLRRLNIMTSIIFRKVCLPDPWCPAPLKLEELDISGLPMPRVPSWLGSFVQLKMLGLALEGVSHEDLSIVGCLPCLLHLSLRTPGYRSKLVIGGCHGFSCLREFCFTGQQPIFTAGSMPRLELLRLIINASKPDTLASAALENLPLLATVQYLLYQYDNNDRVAETAEAALKTAVSSHPNYPSLVRIYRN
uniref:AAA+ ATPase domain-containing protein n=1 Tax=Oryza brachyantha TaxID=4533 RepID=J3MSK7_ORYBR